MQSVPSYEATEVEVVRPGRIGRRVDYIGSPGTIDANPQAFLVDRLYPDARSNRTSMTSTSSRSWSKASAAWVRSRPIR
jgi:hypothetical protein